MPVVAFSPSNHDQSRFAIANDYMLSALRAGISPVMTPLCDSEQTAREILERADALVLTGGVDVDPAYYHEEKLPCCGETMPLRDLFEGMLTRLALQMRLPILGICRGFEVFNCVRGGTLYQDIAQQYSSELFHPSYDVPRDCVHTVEIAPGTLLRQVIGLDAVAVNSRHHQGINKLGKGLRASAFAPDGLVEAFEFEDEYPMLCVQWHPESLADRMPPHARIWEWLAREAAR